MLGKRKQVAVITFENQVASLHTIWWCSCFILLTPTTGVEVYVPKRTQAKVGDDALLECAYKLDYHEKIAWIAWNAGLSSQFNSDSLIFKDQNGVGNFFLARFRESLFYGHRTHHGKDVSIKIKKLTMSDWDANFTCSVCLEGKNVQCKQKSTQLVLSVLPCVEECPDEEDTGDDILLGLCAAGTTLAVLMFIGAVVMCYYKHKNDQERTGLAEEIPQPIEAPPPAPEPTQFTEEVTESSPLLGDGEGG